MHKLGRPRQKPHTCKRLVNPLVHRISSCVVRGPPSCASLKKMRSSRFTHMQHRNHTHNGLSGLCSPGPIMCGGGDTARQARAAPGVAQRHTVTSSSTHRHRHPDVPHVPATQSLTPPAVLHAEYAHDPTNHNEDTAWNHSAAKQSYASAYATSASSQHTPSMTPAQAFSVRWRVRCCH